MVKPRNETTKAPAPFTMSQHFAESQILTVKFHEENFENIELALGKQTNSPILFTMDS